MSLGATPMRKAFGGGVAAKTFEKSRKNAAKMEKNEDGSRSKVVATKNQYYCLYCDEIKSVYRADVPSTYGCKSVAQLDGMTPPMAAWLEQKLGHRSRTVYKAGGLHQRQHSIWFQNMVRKQLYVLALLEVFVDRDFVTGEAIDRSGFWHRGVYSHRTCRILTDMDKTALRLRDACSELYSDEHIVDAIGHVFSGASLLAKRRDGNCAGADIDESDDEDPECTDDPAPKEKLDGHTYWEHFMTIPAVGPFKAMFALYYLERFALSRTVRFQAMAEGDKVFVAGWVLEWHWASCAPVWRTSCRSNSEMTALSIRGSAPCWLGSSTIRNLEKR